MKMMILALLCVGCGSGVEEPPWSGARFGFRCFAEEVGQVRCYTEDLAEAHEPIAVPSTGRSRNVESFELECVRFNPRWSDYFVWVKTGRLCS